MNIQYNQYGNCRTLTHGALKELNNCDIASNKKIFFVNYILQIEECHPLFTANYYNCKIFDDECICNAFILGYNEYEGRPYKGDIISVTKIIINTLPDGEHRLFFCEEVKLLEKGAKFLINPKNLEIISSKSRKIILNNNQEFIKENKNNNNENKELNYDNNNIYSDKKNENKYIIKTFNQNNNNNFIENIDEENFVNHENEIRDKKNNKRNNKNIQTINQVNNNFIIYKEKEKEKENINKKENTIREYNENNYYELFKDINKEKNNELKDTITINIKEKNDKKEIKDENNIKINNINNVINKKINSINNNNITNSPLKKKSKTKLIKIEPQKKDEGLDTKEKEILESINLFIDDFKEGKNIYLEENKNYLPITYEEFEELDKNYEKINSKTNLDIIKNNININKEINNKNINIFKTNFNSRNNIVFINEVEYILKKYKTKSVNIKCRIKKFNHSYKNFYKGCSNCYRKIENKIICCKNGTETFLYNFKITVWDASGELKIFFYHKIGRDLMGIDAEKYKKFLDSKGDIEKIILSEYINDFYNNEYLFTIEYSENKYNDYKYVVINIEKINKIHIYQLVKELKNVLKINHS